MANQEITDREKVGKLEKLPQKGYSQEGHFKIKNTATNKDLIFVVYVLSYIIGMFIYLLLGGEMFYSLGYWVICITFSPLVIAKLFNSKFNYWLNKPFISKEEGVQS